MAMVEDAARVPPGIVMGYAGQSLGKDVSEDFFDLACPQPADLAASGLVFALADGMSGGAGRRAAETCVRTIVSDYYAAPAAWAIGYRLDKIIASVNAWLLSHNVRAGDGQWMFSTLSVLVLHGDEFHIAHVGDTRVYRLRNAHCERLTTDHVWPRRDMRNVLRRAIGLDQHLVVDSFCAELAAGDRFVMVSDGVWEVLGESVLERILGEEADARGLAQRLVHLSAEKQRGYYGRNDATAAVIDVERLPASDAC